MTDVSKATVYRHVEILSSAGILEVADEWRIRGAVERQYRLRQDRAIIDADALEALSAEDYRRGFAAAIAILVAEFNTYLQKDNVDPTADLVGFRQHAIWLSRDELIEMIGELRSAIAPRLTNPQSPVRAQYLLSPILFPFEDQTATREGDPQTPFQSPDS